MVLRSSNKSIIAGALAGLVAFSCVAPANASIGDAPAADATGDVADTTAGQLSDRAVEQFEAGNYDAAIELFELAYAKDPQPNYLYNIARVYEEKGDFAAAVERYQTFVGEPRVDLAARQNAIERLEVLRAALEQLRDEPDAATAVPEPEPSRRNEPQWAEQQPELDTGPRDRIRNTRIAGYSLMGVGGAALVVGSVFGGLALGKSKDADDAEFVDEATKLREQASSQARVADAMLATGGVLVGVGLIVVLATLGNKNRARSQTAWMPMAGRGEAGLGFSHRF